MKKIIPLISLLLATQATQLGNAQEVGDKAYFEFSSNGDKYRITSEFFSEPGQPIATWRIETVEGLYRYSPDTIFSVDELLDDMQSLDNIPSSREKLNKLEEITKKGRTSIKFNRILSDFLDTYSFFTGNLPEWDIRSKHEDVTDLYGKIISYLAFQGFKDIKEEKEKLAREGRGINIIDLALDGRDAFHILDRALGGIAGKINQSDQEIVSNLQKEKQLSQKYGEPYFGSTAEEEIGAMRIISQDILAAFSEASKERNIDEMQREFMERVSNYPRVAVDPMAFAIVGDVPNLNQVDSIITKFDKNHKSLREIYRRSYDDIDFDGDFYDELKAAWDSAFVYYDANINKFLEIYNSNKWVPNKKYINQFKKLDKSYNAFSNKREILSGAALEEIRYNIMKEFSSSPELINYRNNVSHHRSTLRDIKHRVEEEISARVNLFENNIRQLRESINQ